MVLEQSQIINILKSLENDSGGVEVNTKSGGIIYVSNPNEYMFSLNVVLKWAGDHYFGYFTDGDWEERRAQFSLWSLLDISYFVSAYSMLVKLRAARRDHE